MTIDGSGYGATYGATATIGTGIAPGSGLAPALSEHLVASLSPEISMADASGVYNLDDTIPFDLNEMHPDFWALSHLDTVLGELSLSDTDIKTGLQNITYGSVQEELAKAFEHRREQFPSSLAASIDQQSGRFDQYYFSLLSINPRTHPATSRLLSLVMLVSGVVGFKWKMSFGRARPSQVVPGLFPIIPTPAHPSFPSNHATQSYAVSGFFQAVFEAQTAQRFHEPLEDLAKEITDNREYAGIHFAADSKAGRFLAGELVHAFKASATVQELVQESCRELGDLQLPSWHAKASIPGGETS